MEPITAAVIVLFVLVALLLAAGAGLYRRVKELELATFNGVGLRVSQELSDLGRPGQTTIVAKVNRQCPICAEVIAAIARLADDLPADVAFMVVSDDPGFAYKLPPSVRVSTDPQVWRSITVPYAPAMLVVNEQGVIEYTTPAGSGEVVADLVERAAARKEVSL
ncbi:hypothetical protein AB0395_05640 [Streptosporangium sp. NPDC051023]|uniref:hypothetical protein n=1 Tax=Streptosporangium sp. NPDC051023 TaxID=3155410 RepID=UPI00344E49E7